jgi:hypothetical protein
MSPLRLGRRVLDVNVHITLALGPVGQLVRASDHLGGQRLHML